MYFTLTTFGCKVNQYESSGICEMLSRHGYVLADSPETAQNAELHIINSCTVTENSDKKVKSAVAKLKRANPAAKVVLCGCFPKAFPEKAEAAGADIIVQGIFKGFKGLKGFKGFEEFDTAFSPQYSPQNERTRAFLKIQDGCNRHCAYCIIPKARGSVKSRPIADIRGEAQLLADAGHKEIVVTGINLCAYEYSFVSAVAAVCGVDGVRRVRLGSIEPDMITDSDIAALSDSSVCKGKLCGHFHLSLQSGSDSVLRRMNRLYTVAQYRKTVDTIRGHFPNAAVTTDIIVGFPRESDREFAETVAFAEEIGFAKIHVFAFSPREGTAAAEMPYQIPADVKKERSAALRNCAARMRADFLRRLKGTAQEVLMEKPTFGHTRCYTAVKTLKPYGKNSIVNLKIVKAEKDYFVGE